MARKARAKIGQFLGRQGEGNWGRANGGDRDRLGGQDGAIHTHLQEKKGCNTDTTIFSEACGGQESLPENWAVLGSRRCWLGTSSHDLCS